MLDSSKEVPIAKVGLNGTDIKELYSDSDNNIEKGGAIIRRYECRCYDHVL
jgi:hypothetical protein